MCQLFQRKIKYLVHSYLDDDRTTLSSVHLKFRQDITSLLKLLSQLFSFEPVNIIQIEVQFLGNV